MKQEEKKYKHFLGTTIIIIINIISTSDCSYLRVVIEICALLGFYTV
jgi:hypothetical protein